MRIDISIIIPCYNELAYIERCLDSIVENDFSHRLAEIIIVDGMSDDGTRAILDKYVEKYSICKLLDNPDRSQVVGLNIALSEARGDVVVRCDAHSIYPKDYFCGLFDILQSNPEIGNVGRPLVTSSDNASILGRALESAMSSKVGVGMSHRTIKPPAGGADVDTLLFGAWRREVFEEVGGFDTDFVRGQDYEHNVRLRRAGYRVVQVPGEPVIYFTRPTFFKALRKIFQYATVKAHIVKKYGGIPNFRSFVPLTFYAFFSVLFFVDQNFAWFVFALYMMVVLGFSFNKSLWGRYNLLFLVSVLGIHMSHAAGLLYGFFSYFILRREKIIFSGTR
jgi:glycosyltransferase involved in cell wall biosynthesis